MKSVWNMTPLKDWISTSSNKLEDYDNYSDDNATPNGSSREKLSDRRNGFESPVYTNGSNSNHNDASSGEFQDHFGMGKLIEAVNKLQDVANAVGADATKIIELPQIVAIGGQSAGKSSVIESIVGRSFLPRGIGMVTRCPLILQLIRCPLNDTAHRNVNNGTLDMEEFAKFNHSDVIFTDFDKIREEIEAQTEKIAGPNKDVCAEAITLKIYSANVVTLTLVDLPGFVKNPLPIQPRDIEAQVNKLVDAYIKNKNSLILAVTQANTDMVTSESLSRAQKFDADGNRTLAVFTKLDLMDYGTTAQEILTGGVIPVKLGIIGVVNRSQQDIIDQKGIKEQLEDESLFFRKKYPSLASKNGTPYLVKKLHQLLINHICETLPDLKQQVEKKIKEYEILMKEYGEEVSDQSLVIVQIIDKFACAYRNKIAGTEDDIDDLELGVGGAEIYAVCYENYGSDLDAIEPLTGIKDEDILNAVKRSSGVEPPIFVSEASFKKMVRKQISRFETPSLKSLESVHDEMLRIIKFCFQKEMKLDRDRFPKLFVMIEQIVKDLLESSKQNAKKMVENLMKIENYINTRHPVFRKEQHEIDTAEDDDQQQQGDNIIKKTTKWISSMQSRGRQGVNGIKPKPKNNYPVISEEEKKDIAAIQSLITSYFNIVKHAFQDSIPKAILAFLVFDVKKVLQTELISKLHKQELFDDLLKESELVRVKRKDASSMLKAMIDSNKIINEIGDIQI